MFGGMISIHWNKSHCHSGRFSKKLHYFLEIDYSSSSNYNLLELQDLLYSSVNQHSNQARSWLSISGGALQKECNRGVGMILTFVLAASFPFQLRKIGIERNVLLRCKSIILVLILWFRYHIFPLSLLYTWIDSFSVEAMTLEHRICNEITLYFHVYYKCSFVQ
jgi:hypothetical protein